MRRGHLPFLPSWRTQTPAEPRTERAHVRVDVDDVMHHHHQGEGRAVELRANSAAAHALRTTAAVLQGLGHSGRSGAGNEVGMPLPGAPGGTAPSKCCHRVLPIR